MPAPFYGGGHTTIEHERRNPIAGGNQRKDHSPLHQDREADRTAAPVSYTHLFLTVIFDLVVAIGVGLSLACLLFMTRMANVAVRCV